MRTVRIVLVEDHRVVRQGLKALLEAEQDFEIVGEAGDGLVALELVEKTTPDVLVVDLMIPGLSGLEVTRRVRERSPGSKVVVLSMHSNEAYVLEALKYGAAGYVLKDSSFSDLSRAVREVVSGRKYLSPPLSERAIDLYLQHKRKSGSLDPYETLTNREREVFQLTVEGQSASEVAERLSISPRTVESHRANLMRKLALRSQAELIRYALRRGFLPMED